MIELIERWTLVLAAGIEAGAALVIGIATLVAIFRALVLMLQPRRPRAENETWIRLRLGRWLGVALEFEVAADILRTAVAPSWNDIGQLGAIIALRTVLNFFLQREIEQEAARTPRDAGIAGKEQEKRAA